MDSQFRAVEICDGVWWVGAIDWTLRDFHGYATTRASTYNAYLIVRDKVTLIDTVKAPFHDEMMARIASVLPPERIDFVVSHHAEMDHSGCLPRVLDRVRPEKFFASAGALDALARHFHADLGATKVGDNEAVDIGGDRLTFYDTKMLHWPESNVSWLAGARLLFSQDIFGMHLASSERFEDEIPSGIIYAEAAKYFANIVMPFSPVVTRTLARLSSLDLPIEIIAPDHGPVWRHDPRRVVRWYERWAAQDPCRKAVIAYDTMWNSTAMMARSIADGIGETGVSVKVMGMGSSHRSDVATEILECGALLVGSPTINNQIFPTVADLLSYLKGLKRRNLIGAAFGSYGWSGESVKLIEGALEEMKIERAAEGLRVKYVPDASELARCRELGVRIGARLVALQDRGNGFPGKGASE